MQSITLTKSRVAHAVAALVLAWGSGQAVAAGFALQENSGSGLGNAYAGGAAAAEDASTVWSNPAGMSLIKTNQVAAAINLVQPSMKFSNGNSQAAGCYPPACAAPGVLQPLGGNGGDAGSLNVIPNLYLTVPVARDWTFGLGINVPFGLVTEYDGGWIGRYQAIKSDVKTMNINPAIAWQVSPSLSLGAGVSYQQIKGTFTSNVNYSGALLRAAATAGVTPGSATFNAIANSTANLDSFASISGDDWSWGWNVGALWQINPANRIGIAWRSDVKYALSGNAEFSNPALPSGIPAPLLPTVQALAAGVNSKALYNSGVSSDIKVPGIFNISYFGSLNDKWDLMADAQWTHWSTIQDLTFYRTDGTPTPLSSTPEFFKDTWRFAVGANYKLDDAWKFRMGLAFDQSPVQEADRTPRLPDSDRTWLSGGVQYKWGKDWKFDLGATYIWVNNGNINNGGHDPATNQPSIPTYGLVNGTYNNNVVIVSGQATWSF